MARRPTHSDLVRTRTLALSGNGRPVLERLRTGDEELLIEIERKYAGRLSFRSDPTSHQEKFIITDANTNAELKA